MGSKATGSNTKSKDSESLTDKALDQIADELREKKKKPVDEFLNFWWDTICTAVITLLFGVASFNTLTLYFRNVDIACLVIDNRTTSLTIFVNEFCKEQLPDYLKYVQVWFFLEITLIAALQKFWKLIPLDFSPSQFLSLVNSMSHKKDKNIGCADSNDFARARHLETLFYSYQHMCSYVILKLVAQLLTAMVGLSLSITFFIIVPSPVGLPKCTNDSFPEDLQWPLSSSDVYCVYPELNNVKILIGINVIVVTVIIVSNFIGAICLCVYKSELDYKRLVKFKLNTGLATGNRYYSRPCWYLYCCCCYPKQKSLHMQISCDMAFMLMRLYATNTKKADGLFGILMESYLEYNEQLSDLKRSEFIQSIIKLMQCKRCFKSKKDSQICVILVTLNMSVLANILAKKFKENLIMCINLNSHIDNTYLERRSNGIIILHIPSDSWRKKEDQEDKALKVEEWMKVEMMKLITAKNYKSYRIVFAPQNNTGSTVFQTQSRVKELLRCIFTLDKLKSAKDIGIIFFNPLSFPKECHLLCCCCWSRKGPYHEFELPPLETTSKLINNGIEYELFQPEGVPEKWCKYKCADHEEVEIEHIKFETSYYGKI